jgi:predicted CXXCH cytochrome family protein
MSKKLPKHIARLIFLLGFFLLVALIAKSYLTDPSFYKFGHYRADAIGELAAGEPVYKGSAFCLGCHEQRKTDWSNGVHVAVQCEVCHGPDRGCPENGKAMLPADTIRLCIMCHEAMPSRPARQPQIVFAEHPFPDEEKPQCKTCHNPHSPTVVELLAEAPDTETGAEPSAQPPAAAEKCLKCHGDQGQGRRKNPPLAGLESAVFIEMMNNFKSGAAESKTMARYAKTLGDEEIAELARYYESLPATQPEPPPE